MSYHIGSFNVRDLNYSNRSTDGEELKRDFEKIAEIIVGENFDVVAVQELNSESALRYLVSKCNLHKNAVREYTYIFGPDMPTSSKDPERYGFIWNAKRLRLVKTPRNNNPRYYIYAGGNRVIRPPYYGRFTARGMLGGSNFELRLLNTHIRDAVSEKDRIEEFNILVQQVMPRVCDHTEVSEESEIMPAYTFLLGDYNLCLNKGPRAIFKIDAITPTNYTGKFRFYQTVQEELTSLRKVGAQTSIQECYANNYDHFTYEMDLNGKLRLKPSRVEAIGTYFEEEKEAVDKLRAYRMKVSDHVPIAMEMDLK